MHLHVPHGEPPNLVLRRFPPLRPNHACVGLRCPVCKVSFVAGDILTLFLTTNAYGRQQVQPTHYVCAKGETEGGAR